MGMFALALRDCFVHLFKGDARRAGESALSFVSFSLGLFLQRKAAKRLCCQDLLDAFSFATRGTKEKALQKEKCRFFAQAAGLPLLKKRSKTIAWVCANSPINPNLSTLV